MLIRAVGSGRFGRYNAIELGPSVCKPVYFIRTGDVYDLILIGLRQIDLGEKNLFVLTRSLAQCVAVVVDNHASADELPSPLDSDPINRGEVYVVLASPRVDDELGSAPRAGRPVSWKDDQLGSQQLQRASGFGKARVIADVDSDS